MRNQKKIRFAITGAMGRMGQAIAKLSQEFADLELTAAFEHSAHTELAKVYGRLIGVSGFEFPLYNFSSAVNGSVDNIDGIIDFSFKDATIENLPLYEKIGRPLVIGTTGFTSGEELKIAELAKKIPILLSSNMSLGVNLLNALVKQAVKALNDKGFDIELMEVHHRLKKDSPSGTAKMLERAILETSDRSTEDMIYGREGMIGARKQNEVGSFALRGGDVVGDHTVYFFGDGERLELKHQAHSRNTFARGALNALIFICDKKNGLYNMNDVLGI